MQLLPRYAASLEDRRKKVIELEENYLYAILQGQEPEFIAQIPLPDGRTIYVVPLLYLAANIGISPGPPFQEANWYADIWMYQSQVRALMAALAWDGEGEPEGWYRHNTSGRRRPGGDPAREYIEI